MTDSIKETIPPRPAPTIQELVKKLEIALDLGFDTKFIRLAFSKEELYAMVLYFREKCLPDGLDVEPHQIQIQKAILHPAPKVQEMLDALEGVLQGGTYSAKQIQASFHDEKLFVMLMFYREKYFFMEKPNPTIQTELVNYEEVDYA